MAGKTSEKFVREWLKALLKVLLVVVAVVGLGVVVFQDLGVTGRLGRQALEVRQKAQLHNVETAVELAFGYPPSDAEDPTGQPYCGAMKLAEVIMGQDGLGFHGESVFRADGKDANGVANLYDRTDLDKRRGPYLPPEHFECLTLGEIYGAGNTGAFDPNTRVLCDAYGHKFESGYEGGMPILYYKADTSKGSHDMDDPNNPDNIYDYRDNQALLGLGVPGKPEARHPMFADPRLFYRITRSDEVETAGKPVNADSYILISAGEDGLYGTKDDICNFEFEFPGE